LRGSDTAPRYTRGPAVPVERTLAPSTSESPSHAPSSSSASTTAVEGKALFRIRQSHVANHYKPLIAQKAYAAVKLDLPIASDADLTVLTS